MRADGNGNGKMRNNTKAAVSSLLLFIFMQNRFDSKLSLLSGLILRWNVHASISKFAVDKGLFCRDWWTARKVGGCVS